MVTDRQAQKNALYDSGWRISLYQSKPNSRKREVYWIGFLSGARASGRIEQGEPEALEQEARKFVEFFDCADSRDMIMDLSAGCFDGDGDMLLGISDLIDVLRQNCEVAQSYTDADHLNEFLGFCSGVICDGKLLDREVRAIQRRFQNSVLSSAPIFSELRSSIEGSLIDGVLDEQERQEIHAWLAKLVGSGFVDTGLPNLGNVAQIAEPVTQADHISLAGKRIVVTGELRMGTRRHIAMLIEQAGGVFEDAVTKKTDYIVVSSTASPNWRLTHAGSKLEKAKKLIDAGSSLQVLVEDVFEAALLAANGNP